MTVEYVIEVPEDWDAGSIEFHRNDSSWCSNNARAELRKLFDHLEQDGIPCLCNRASFEYVREATEEDEASNGVFVEKLPG